MSNHTLILKAETTSVRLVTNDWEDGFIFQDHLGEAKFELPFQPFEGLMYYPEVPNAPPIYIKNLAWKDGAFNMPADRNRRNSVIYGLDNEIRKIYIKHDRKTVEGYIYEQLLTRSKERCLAEFETPGFNWVWTLGKEMTKKYEINDPPPERVSKGYFDLPFLFREMFLR